MEYNLLCVKLIPSRVGKRRGVLGFARLSESRSGRGDGAKLETGREEKRRRQDWKRC